MDDGRPANLTRFAIGIDVPNFVFLEPNFARIIEILQELILLKVFYDDQRQLLIAMQIERHLFLWKRDESWSWISIQAVNKS